MAYKDEYEVARLYTDGSFLAQVAETFDGDNLRFEFHSGAAALGATRSYDRAAAQDELRSVAAAGFPAAGEPQVPARNGLRSVRPHAGAPHGKKADRRLPSDARQSARRADSRTIITSPWRLRRSPKRSAASAMSNNATSPPRKPTKQRCSSNCRPDRRRCSRRPNSGG